MRKRALITGGAGGIGLELCKLIARDGYDLLIVDMNEIGLSKAARELSDSFDVRVDTLVHDLSLPEEPRRVFESVSERDLSVDLLINNAGYGMRGNFADLSLADQLAMINVNSVSLVGLTGVFLPMLLDRPSAGIINIASIAAFQPGPSMAVYYATKAFVLSFSEALALELNSTGVTVTCVCPGPTKTEFADRAGATDSIAFSTVNTMCPMDVAKQAYEGYKRRDHIVIPGIKNKLVVLGSRLVTPHTAGALAGTLNESFDKMTELLPNLKIIKKR